MTSEAHTIEAPVSQAPLGALTALSPPPREVPLSVRLGLLFGGFTNQFGWFFFSFGMMFYWGLATQADFEEAYFWGQVESAPGKVTACEKTAYSVKRRRVAGDWSVYKIDYRYSVEGKEYDGVGYAIGGHRPNGQDLRVEYPAGEPGFSRIQGGWRKPMPLAVLWVVIFPIFGFCFFAHGFRHGRRASRLLADGVAAVGTLVNTESTGAKFNGRRVQKFTYDFPAADGNVYRAKATTHRAETLADREQPLLYDPANPGDATLLNHLPCRPEVDEHGQILPRSARRTALVLFLPAVSIIGNAVAALTRFAAPMT